MPVGLDDLEELVCKLGGTVQVPDAVLDEGDGDLVAERVLVYVVAPEVHPGRLPGGQLVEPTAEVREPLTLGALQNGAGRGLLGQQAVECRLQPTEATRAAGSVIAARSVGSHLRQQGAEGECLLLPVPGVVGEDLF